jgi:translation initiation factor 2 beta subunit (eIF-2beta)/eIF-5
MTCPRCAEPTTAMTVVDRVDFYRCAKCGLIWHISRADHSIVTIIGEP